MHLKLATLEDREDFLRLTELFYKETPFFPTLQYSQDRVKRIFDLAIDSKHQQVLVLLLQDQQKVCGLLVGVATEVPFSDDKVASELAWYVESAYRGRREALQLVDAYEAWAVRVGCSSVSMSLLPTLTDLSKLYERKGYKKTEISYLKGLK